MEDFSYLQDILVLLLASAIVIAFFKKIGLSPVLGYLVSGAAIGPFGFGIISSIESTKSFGTLGIIFLLFTIGLELTFAKLIKLRKYVLGFGGLQVLITTVIIALIIHKLFLIGLEIAIIIGSALSLSSTSIVLEVINENGEQSTRVARLSFSVLLLQDLAAIPLLVLLPILSKTNLEIGHALFDALIDAVIAVTAIFLAGRLLLRPIYRVVVQTKNDVLFLSTTLIIILGSAYVSQELGLSFAFGAFIAGLMVAETEYKYHVEDDVKLMKSLLLGLFFMTIGMSFDFDVLIQNLPNILMAALALIILKTLIVIFLCKIFKFPLGPSIHTGLLLSQGGEFAFVLFIMAVNQKFIDSDLSEFLMTVVTVTMALTPLLAKAGSKIKSYLYTKEILQDNKIQQELGDISKHIIIIGFGRISRIIAYLLKKKGVSYIILESNHQIARIQKNNGFNIYCAEAMNKEILEYVAIEKAESVIVAIEDDLACMKITRFIHENFPNVTIITKSENSKNVDRFKKVGANMVVSKNTETALQLSKIALSSAHIKSKEISSELNDFRAHNEEILRNLIPQEASLND
jgi:CPA2 family monovalent cation:H+ antiporter-2